MTQYNDTDFAVEDGRLLMPNEIKRKVVENCTKYDMDINSNSDHVLNALRILHAEKKINLRLFVDGNEIGITANGRLEKWPDCINQWTNDLDELLEFLTLK